MPKIHQYIIKFHASLHEMLYTRIYAWYSSFDKKILRRLSFIFIQAHLDSVYQEDNVVWIINMYKKAKNYRLTLSPAVNLDVIFFDV